LTVFTGQESRANSGEKLRFAAWGLVAAAPAFVAFAVCVLNQFYRYGAVLLDTGLLADLAWRKAPALPMSPVFQAPGFYLSQASTFYSLHVAPIFTLLSALSWLTPLSLAQWFALFTGIAHALLAIAVFWILSTDYALNKGWRIGLAVLLAIAFSFNGLAIAQVRYPHFEILIVASLMLFLVAWWHKRPILAAFFFALCLICREDAGFHVVSVLGVLVVLNWFYGIPLSEQKRTLIFLVIAFAYSAGALLLTGILFPGQSNFARVYLGDPPFAHLDAGLAQLRTLVYLFGRSYIFLPAGCAVIWAIVARNPYLLVGYIACIPWTLLHFVAKSEVAGNLAGYYGFPFMVAAFWPLIGWQMKARRSPRWEPLAGFGVMILASFTALSAQPNPTGIPLWSGFTNPPTLAEQSRVQLTMAAIHADHSKLGRILAGGSIASLNPGEFRYDETFLNGPPTTRDTLIFFAGDRDSEAIAGVASASGLRHHYAVSGTPMRIITNIKLSDLPAMGALVAADTPSR